MNTTQHYCVPMALSILTGLPVEGVESKLRDEYLGDVQIGGIYLGLALKFLSDNGYKWMPLREGSPLSMYTHEIDLLVEIRGHALVLNANTVHDNSYPNGIFIGYYPRRAERVIRAYRISR